MVIFVPPLVDNTKQNPLSTITNYNNNTNSQNQLINSYKNCQYKYNHNILPNTNINPDQHKPTKTYKPDTCTIPHLYTQVVLYHSNNGYAFSLHSFHK